MNFVYIFGTICFTVYGQIIIKWRVMKYGNMPDTLAEKCVFLGRVLLDPFVISGLFAAFIASLFWMVAMTKFEISFAYPFMGLTFVLVLICGNLFLNEPINLVKLTGAVLIVLGIVVGSRG